MHALFRIMKELHLDFGHFELHKDYVIGTINEGVHFDLELNKILEKNFIAHFGFKNPFVYISNRINDYSIDPMVHKYNSAIDSLRAIAILETPHHKPTTIDVESRFFKPKPLQIFKDKKEAYEWCQNHLSLRSY